MLFKKFTTIISIILFISTTLFGITKKDKLIIKEIEEEKYELNLYQAEIEHLKKIVIKKKQVEKLQKDGKTNEIKKLFTEDFAKVDSVYKQNNYKDALKKLVELKSIYKQPNYFQEIAFLKGKIAAEIGMFPQAYKLLTEYTTKYSQFHHLEEAKYYLQFAEFNLQKYKEIVILDKNYRGKRDKRYKFILANAFYSLNEFQKAFDLASELISSKNYGFDAQFLTGLCVRKISSNKDAIRYFQIMINKESNPERLGKLFLTLARTSYSDKNYVDGLIAYKNYIKTVGLNSIEDNILYEIGWCALNAEENILAGKCFKKILDKEPRSNLYDDAKFSIGVIFARLGGMDDAVKIVEERISQNENMYNYVEEKKELIKLYKKIVSTKDKKNTERVKNIIAEEEKALQLQLDKSNIVLNKFLGKQVDYQKILKLAILEEEIIFHTTLLEEMKELESLFEKKGKEISAKKIDEGLSNADNLLRLAELDVEANIFLTNFLYYREGAIELLKAFLSEKKSIDEIKDEMDALVTSYFKEKYHLNLIKENLSQELEKARNEENTEIITKIVAMITEAYDTSILLDAAFKELKELSNQQSSIVRDLGSERDTLKSIDNSLYSLLEKAKEKDRIGLIPKIQSKIGEVDTTVSQLGKKLERYYTKQKRNKELQQKFINQQKLVKTQRENLEKSKKVLAKKLEKKVKKMIIEDKNGLIEENNIVEKNYYDLMASLEEIINQKIAASHYAVNDLLLERQAIINDNYSATQKALSKQRGLYRKLLEKVEESNAKAKN